MRAAPAVRRAAAARLAAAGCVAATEEAGELCAAAPGPAQLESLLCRREAGEPLAWVTGWTVFCGCRVTVHRGVYVPRHQTEELARRAAAALGRRGVLVDLCTGSGAVAVAVGAAVPGATVVGTDRDPAAAANAAANGVRVVVADLGDGLATGCADVVSAVAPYVPTGAIRLLARDVQAYEPVVALNGGEEGLDVLRRVVAAASRLLVGGGWLLVEVGAGQERGLAPALEAHGFASAVVWHDEDGDVRGLAARRRAGGRAAGAEHRSSISDVHAE